MNISMTSSNVSQRNMIYTLVYFKIGETRESANQVGITATPGIKVDWNIDSL